MTMRTLRAWIDRHRFELFGPDADADANPVIHRDGSALVVQMPTLSGPRRVVIKPAPTAGKAEQTPYDYHDRLVAAHPALASVTPHFLPVGRGSPWVVMDYLPGQTLESYLIQLLRLGSKGVARGCDVMRRAGAILAQFHQVPASHIGLSPGNRPIRSFMESWERMSQQLRWLLRTLWLDNGRWEQFAQRWRTIQLDRRGTAAVPIDAQLKNVLVTNDGQMWFIDLDYEASHEAMGAAYFLVSIDRLRVRRPWIIGSTLAVWRNAFLEGYLPHVPSYVEDELTFFYPWMLLHTLVDHCRHRPWAGPVISLVYAWQLATFVHTSLERQNDTAPNTFAVEPVSRVCVEAGQQIGRNR